jgi:hypothetical protein
MVHFVQNQVAMQKLVRCIVKLGWMHQLQTESAPSGSTTTKSPT